MVLLVVVVPTAAWLGYGFVATVTPFFVFWLGGVVEAVAAPGAGAAEKIKGAGKATGWLCSGSSVLSFRVKHLGYREGWLWQRSPYVQSVRERVCLSRKRLFVALLGLVGISFPRSSFFRTTITTHSSLCARVHMDSHTQTG